MKPIQLKLDVATLTSDRTIPLSHTRHEPRKSYLATAVFMTVVVFVGFWSPYFAPLLQGNAARPWVIHLHAILFVGWMALLFAQVLFVHQGRIQLHRTVGNIGIAYGFLMFVMGVIVAFTAPLMHLHNGEWPMERASGFLLISLRAIVVFGGFFAASVMYKRKPEIHKRLILLATVALLFAPVGRIVNPARSPLVFLAVWFSPILVMMWRDAFTPRRVHPVFIIGLFVLLVGLTPVLFRESEGYMRFGRSLLTTVRIASE